MFPFSSTQKKNVTIFIRNSSILLCLWLIMPARLRLYLPLFSSLLGAEQGKLLDLLACHG
jgi:hypothetical protein